jgi:hypothetical protein
MLSELVENKRCRLVGSHRCNTFLRERRDRIEKKRLTLVKRWISVLKRTKFCSHDELLCTE